MIPKISSLHEHISSLAKKYPSKDALVALDENGEIVQKISCGELLKEVDTAATYLSQLGVQKGDRVALAFKNSPELLILSWAAWASGVVTVPMDTKRDTGEQYEYKIKLNDAKILIAQKGVLKHIDEKFLRDVRVIEFGGMNDLRSRSSAKNNQGETLIWSDGLDHLALILFTSGTTGHPKGAKLSLQNLIINADGIREWLNFSAEDTFLVVLPLHHINSTTFCLSTLLAGGTIAIPPGYSNSHFWQVVAGTGATITSVVQSIVFDQLHREDEFETFRENIRLQRMQIGSAPVMAQSVQEFRKKFGIPLFQGYGQTETALRVTGVPMGLSEALYEKLVDENSIGTPMQWADLRIADESGKFLGEGKEGELVVKGPAIMEGYVAGEPAFRDGYFLTGDVGLYRTIEGRKYFFLKGRKREIIIKGGINISPIAVENALKKISHDIDQVHIVSVPDERYGEEVGAVISWKKGIDEASAKRSLKCSLLFGTSHLSAYETPKYMSALPVEDLPMTSTGKVQRSILKIQLPYERFESIFGLLKTPQYRFTALHRYSRWVSASYALYNQCWSPLTTEKSEYERNIPKQLIILAAEHNERLAGQIAIVRTNLSTEELLKTTYRDILTPNVLDPQGKALVCISICSAGYQPKPVPDLKEIPDADAVRMYLRSGHDPVMRFHEKPKGGLREGARLVDVIPGGRLEDHSSLGYNMLVQYPAPKNILVSHDAPVSNQLIEMALLLAGDLGIEQVYAYSRPGGLASYIAKKGST